MSARQKCCHVCASHCFMIYESGGDLFLRCANCHVVQERQPRQAPAGTLVPIEDAANLNWLPMPARTERLLTAAFETASEQLDDYFQSHPEKLT